MKNKDRLIARMILGFGLSLTIASAVACGITHPKFTKVKDNYWTAKENKDAYLDTYEQTEEFKSAYNTDVQALNDRLIARAIDGDAYDKEIEKLNDNTYTEQVLFENANEQTKAEFNEINQKYLDAYDNWNKNAVPFLVSVYGTFFTPLVSGFLYHVWKPNNKNVNPLEEHSLLKNISSISPEAMKRVMEISDKTPYHGGNYHPINAEETRKYIAPVLDEIKNQPNTAIPNVPRSIDACIFNTEETQENKDTLTK